MFKFTLSGIVPVLVAASVFAGDADPGYLKDRGPGVPTSRFGTYVEKGELLIYPLFAYTRDHNQEYQPAQYGFGIQEDLRARYRSGEGQIFIGYGLTDWLAVQLETGFISATLEKSSNDTSLLPVRIEESGFGDIEGQLVLRLIRESDHIMEVFTFLGITATSHQNKLLIGATIWDLKPGIGITRGFSWGTLTIRSTLENNRAESKLDIGETAIEYLKRLSPSWRLFLGLEGGEGGGPDEWNLISGVQWRISRQACLVLNNSVGVNSKSTDWAPEIGVMFTIPTK